MNNMNKHEQKETGYGKIKKKKHTSVENKEIIKFRQAGLDLNSEYTELTIPTNEGIIGVDEVGVGCSAGSLLVCAVYLDRGFEASLNEMNKECIRICVKDSKKFAGKNGAAQREFVSKWLQSNPHVHYILKEYKPAQIDEWNPFGTRLMGFKESVLELLTQLASENENENKNKNIISMEEYQSIQHILIDGDLFPLALAHELEEKEKEKKEKKQIHMMVKGDSKSFRIAAASMIAKTIRDQQMMELHLQMPQYGFDKHKGYCHVSHKLAIMKHGMTEYHRKSFRMELTEKEKRQSGFTSNSNQS